MQQKYIQNYKNPADDTDRSGYAQGKDSFVGSRQVTIPGTKSFHLYNTLLLIFLLFQTIIYAVQGVKSPCSGSNFYTINLVSSIFYGFMGVYIYALMVPIFTLIVNCRQRGYTFIIIYTIIAVLAKVGVIITAFVATSGHVGNYIVGSDVKVSIMIASVGEIFSLCVQLLFIRHLRKVNQVKEVQMFMDSGRKKGYFWSKRYQ